MLNAAFYFSSCACLHSKRNAIAGARLKEPTVGKACKLGDQRWDREGGEAGLSPPESVGEAPLRKRVKAATAHLF